MKNLLIFQHWLVGMVYVFYFASFVILLREVLRPGVLWFLRNLNDPDFNPIQEMIHLSIARHLRRFCASLVMFGTSIMVMLYVPSRIVKHFLPSFLPYQTSTSRYISCNVQKTLQGQNNCQFIVEILVTLKLTSLQWSFFYYWSSCQQCRTRTTLGSG